MRCLSLLLAAATIAACGAARYATPGPAADLARLATPTVGAVLERAPASRLPAHVAIVRLQGPGYRSRTATGWGRGAFSIVTTPDVETEEDFARIARLPRVAGAIRLNRMLVPHSLETEEDLRLAAARLRADLVLAYTFATEFEVKRKLKPAAVLTLGLLPDRRATVRTVASAIILDTRTGFVYGAVESQASEERLANAWGSEGAVDSARRRAEREAFEKLLEHLEQSWPAMVVYSPARG
jgi:hypothetical protein